MSATYRWLTSDAAAPYLAAAAAGDAGLALTTRLRQELSAEQTRAVLEQAGLRGRAWVKFSRAEHMFFTPLGLEQATDQVVAAYKARRFPTGGLVVDFCCGIGGDLLGFAGRGPVLGIDADRSIALLARANLRSATNTLPHAGLAEVVAARADPCWLGAAAAWHIDPDRRPQGRRTTRVALHEPGPDAIDRLLAASADGAVKLAPAAELPPHWPPQVELEWISRQGSCRQLVAWFGALVDRPGRRRATILLPARSHRAAEPPGGSREIGVSTPPPEPALADAVNVGVRTVVDDEPRAASVAAGVGRYVFEPDAAVLAAELTGTLAAEHRLAALFAGAAYLTADHAVEDAALAVFAVDEVLPFDVRRVKALLRARRIGQLEVKQRGTGLEPAEVQRQLKVDGDQSATLLLARLGKRVIAILARRMAGR